MGKQSRERREKWAKLQEAREIEGVIKRATLLDYFIACNLPPFLNDRSDYSSLIASFNIQSVSDMLDGQYVDITEPIRLPFDTMFMEMNWVAGVPVGVLLNAVDDEHLDYSHWVQHLHHKSKNLISGNIFLPDFKHGGFDLIYDFSCSLDDDFRLLECVEFPDSLKDAPDYVNETLKASCHDSMGFIFYALELMNARNVEFIEHAPASIDSAIYERQFGIPLTKYKTLAIKSKSKRFDGECKPQQHFDVMPLHLRRGNLAHYADDAPLFGKFTGTFWRPATVVGNPKNGIVDKDYKVLAPSAD